MSEPEPRRFVKLTALEETRRKLRAICRGRGQILYDCLERIVDAEYRRWAVEERGRNNNAP